MTQQRHLLWPWAVFVVVFALFGCLTMAQENAQTRIPNSLIECYQDNQVFERDNRLPMTLNILLELIRKVEDSRDYTGTIRELAVQMVHRFRQDGIERAPGVNTSPTIIPFSPSAFQFSKHRILLSRLLQGNAIGFPNATLTTEERVTHSFVVLFSFARTARDSYRRYLIAGEHNCASPRASRRYSSTPPPNVD